MVIVVHVTLITNSVTILKGENYSLRTPYETPDENSICNTPECVTAGNLYTIL